MKKIYLASYMETHNHGPGRKIAISSSKPDDFEVSAAFEYFIPPTEIIDSYKKIQKISQDNASEFFVSSYESQLKDFFTNVKTVAENNNTSVVDELPFENGDTLLSWERAHYTSYRPIIAKFLEEAGYDVVLK